MKIPGLNIHIYRNDASGTPKTGTPDLDTVSRPETVAQAPRETRMEWAKKASVRERSRWLWARKLGLTITENTRNPFRDPSETGHFIQGMPYKLSETTPPEVRTYIDTTLCNLNHESLEQLHNRARAFLAHRAAEHHLLEQTDTALKDASGTSKALQQSAWMIDVQRQAFAQIAPGLDADARASMQARYLEQGNAGRNPVNGKAIAAVSKPTAAEVMAMLVTEQQGPFTLAQSARGAEIALAVHLLSKNIVEVASRSEVMGFQVRSVREPDLVGTDKRPSRVRHGLNLSPDTASKIHEELGLPIRTGLSGSASFMALSHYHACKTLDVPLYPPGVEDDEYEQIVIDLAFHYFCTGELPEFIAAALNEHRVTLGLAPKTVELHSVQTHSYPEVSGPVEWGMQRHTPNPDDMRESALKAARRLDENNPDRTDRPQAG